jgi:hypothetical protein
MQGIAARLAQRQASSERAQDYAVQMPAMGQIAWGVVEEERERKRGERREEKL